MHHPKRKKKRGEKWKNGTVLSFSKRKKRRRLSDLPSKKQRNNIDSLLKSKENDVASRSCPYSSRFPCFFFRSNWTLISSRSSFQSSLPPLTLTIDYSIISVNICSPLFQLIFPSALFAFCRLYIVLLGI